jgi:uncharacterized protein with von Willebrand factor type A (vWA) domain
MTAFDTSALERRYAFLDDCPEFLLDSIVPFPDGTLEDRVAGARAWRDALLRGELPGDGAWPPPHIAGPARKAIAELGILRFLPNQPDLVDAVLADIVGAFGRQDERLRADVARRLRELEQLERQRLTLADAKKSRRRPQEPQPLVTSELRKRLAAVAMREMQERTHESDAELTGNWEARVRAWSQISEVFCDLGDLLGRGWDLSLGVLKHLGWKDLIALANLVAKLPQVQEIIRTLGRLQASQDGETVTESIFVPMLRLEEELHEVRTPHVPAEMRGIERSDAIARMLPTEAAMLGHPKLKLLWHARRAERALLTYRVEGIEIERRQIEREVQVAQKRERPRPQRGPIVAVIDTSGSMHGTPELVAKALVLEAVRVAHREKRRCFLYGYSGPGQVLEQELDLSESGIGRLLGFLAQSFGGGTDIGAMHAVVRRLDDADWRKADVFLATDGEWVAPRDVVAAVKRARARGTRFHGVQIGSTWRSGLQDICDPVHVFSEWWRVVGDLDG